MPYLRLREEFVVSPLAVPRHVPTCCRGLAVPTPALAFVAVDGTVILLTPPVYPC